MSLNSTAISQNLEIKYLTSLSFCTVAMILLSLQWHVLLSELCKLALTILTIFKVQIFPFNSVKSRIELLHSKRKLYCNNGCWQWDSVSVLQNYVCIKWELNWHQPGHQCTWTLTCINRYPLHNSQYKYILCQWINVFSHSIGCDVRMYSGS